MTINQSLTQRSSNYISPIDWVAGVGILILGTLFGFRLSVGPIAWDDTLYLHTAATLTRDPTILNRYFHIFILRLGIFLEGGNPFAGAYLSGAFIFCLTAALVYANARILSGAYHPWHGVLALLFLLSAPYFLLNFGSSLADFTVMTMIQLGILCFLLTIRHRHECLWLFALNGFVFFCSIKSKESGIILSLLIVGLLIVNNRPFRWQTMLSRLAAILAGIALAQIGFIILNGLLLKDAWFGLRFSDIQALIDFNNLPYKEPLIAGSYFNAIAQFSLLAPFCLTLISAAYNRESIKSMDWPVYLLPLGFFALLILTQIKYNFGVMDRYTIPALPVLAILAPQYIQFEKNSLRQEHQLRRQIIPVLLGITAMLVAYLISNGLFSSLGRSFKWSQADFMTTILGPLGLILLITAAIFVPSNKTWGLLVLIAATALITLPAIQMYRGKLASGTVRQDAVNRLAPMTAFSYLVQCTHGNVYVSQNYHDEIGILSRDQQSSFWMFDLSFNCSTRIEQFFISHNAGEILTNHFAYAFLTKTDFNHLMSQPETADRLQQKYAISSNPGQTFYLLIGK